MKPHKDQIIKNGEEKGEFENIFNNAPDAMFIHDLQGNFLEVNEKACENLGYSKETLLKMNAKDIDAPEYASQIKNKIEKMKKTGEATMETAHITKKGKRLPIELSSKIINYQNDKAVFSIARSVSNRNKFSELKKQSETLFNLIPSAVFTVDRDKKITGWNKAAEKITGFSAEEIIGHKCSKFTLSPCEEKCGLLDEKVKKPIYGKECIIKNKKGEKIKISKNVGTLRDENGKFIGGIESFEDLSEIKKVQKKLEEKIQELKKMNDLMIGREEKMIELKEKIKKLENEN
jgi:PAS domain S-box-containing protein